ncbi:chloride channel protein [Salmonella enterica]|uniref:Chloride channel protein n=1 Tax=Salmonella enterica subsp. enterica serovar Denver TaxID=1954177 RepID=A0A657FI60_SALET|nr:chloride channel protein [Salmonella enterica]EAW2243110.1 chloride channel protein [Salmonella enterica subsp. enterica]ECS7544031.1 chloride channel protein [Salmonella enterica subsp. enterica serovar Denver]EEJ6745590.1 chloride channel protein [Salmonella enterica subsp. enterica serovar Oslo]EAZ1837532.1 chloride channel protein [Salmonella enterica]
MKLLFFNVCQHSAKKCSTGQGIRMTPFISVLISYTFIALDALAEELEDPFGTENNDLPLDAICNAIEIDLLQMNDERDIPDKRYQLT